MYKADELIKILKAAREVKVSHLEVGDIKIDFSAEELKENKFSATKEELKAMAHIAKEVAEEEDIKVTQEMIEEAEFNNPQQIDEWIADGKVTEDENGNIRIKD